MQKKLHLFLILFFVVGVSSGIAQQEDTTTIQIKEVEIPAKLLPYDNPMVSEDEAFSASGEPAKQKLDNFEKDVMRRISDIYRTHVNAVEAQVQDDPLSAEKHIKDALNSLQELLDTYPEVQSNPRFSELYRSVMTEYREFYGIKDTFKEEEGEIFAIQEELFSDNDEWVKEEYVLPKNITTPKTEVPLVQNRQVNRHLMYFTLKRPEVMESWLQRKEKYFPMMRQVFEEEGLPTELIHLAMVESGLNPRARSWAAAVGMWQFIRATGSMYGLEVNWWIDERRDPEKATRAAARHLKDLYNIWGDWHLAMANYNISPRGLKRAIRAAGKEDYWAAYPYLPRETQGYIPGFIAATMINMNPTEFGFKEEYKNEEYNYKVYEVAPLMPLDALADAAGISTDKLKEYNPELLRWATPPGNNYPLKLPVGTKQRFASNYEDIPKNKRSQNVAMHTVNSGETLGYIAQKYGTSVRALYESNERLSSTIYPGQKIVVPLAPGSNEQLAVNRPTNQPRGKTSTKSKQRSKSKAPANSATLSYEVKSGDTVGHIAEWYDVRAWQIRSWNGTSNVIRAGEDITVYVPKSKKAYYSQVNTMSFSKKQQIEREQRSGKDVTEAYLASASDSGETIQYTVRSNDTLIEIANSFGVSVNQIKRLNNLNNSRIYVGQKLNIKPE
ncbi:LysM peptidoglycan-binding domain-containing protein [Fodinibius saliphilus]|uniref:LysM peptidoglycan-binding domain-containing protein n=1 Tax=Fodinibius saliphilus TaxID=1920650 RepID=UPI0011093FFD|nr:LysM peptidoglycan-binding domain-containing protein [Fodinibius saliphilus]